MSAAENPRTAQQSKRFLYLYALAVSGGAVAYVPFLTVLLPNQAAILWGKDALTVLAQVAFAGAITASLGNILFGWASDRGQSRRPWIFAGLILSCAMLPAMQLAANPTLLIIMIICWQFGLNMMLSPLSAWAGDSVPDSQKGLLGGLLAFAPALGAVSGVLVTVPGLFEESERLIVVSLMVLLMVGPVLLLGRPKPMPQLVEGIELSEQIAEHARYPRSSVVKMWTARLFVQIAEASLFAFLLLWFQSVSPEFRDNDAATLFATVLATAVFVTLIVGGWSDREDRPILPLGICAGIAAVGLLTMALAEGLTIAIAGFVVFGLSSSVFLALHSSQTLRVLPAPKTRGRDLGLFNLTNTIPSLIMPWLMLALVPTYGYAALFVVLAGLAVLACIMLLTIRRQ